MRCAASKHDRDGCRDEWAMHITLAKKTKCVTSRKYHAFYQMHCFNPPFSYHHQSGIKTRITYPNNSTASIHQPPLSPNSLAQSSNSFRPCLLTLGLMFTKLASKSTSWIGRIWSMDICSSASPRERRGPMAASLARAVMSEPEKPGIC